MNVKSMNKYPGDLLSMSKKVYSMLLLIIIICLCANPASAQYQSPLTLQEGLKIVTEESRIVKIARLAEDMAGFDVKMARSALLPTISASASHTNLSNQPTAIIMGMEAETASSHYYAYSISIQQILFDFRGSLSRYDASRMMLEAKKHDTTRIRNTMALDFTSCFYNYLESRHLVEAATKEIESIELHSQNATRLYEGGVITRNDLLQAQVRLSDSRHRLISAKNHQAVCAAKLNNLLIRPIYAEVQAVDPSIQIDPSSLYDPKESWKEASMLRPEILIVDRTIRAVDHEIVMHKSEFFPKFYVRASNDYMKNPYQRYENNLSVMFGMSINLFEGGRMIANVRKSQSQKSQLLEQRARLADEIQLELRYHSLDLQNAYARFLASEDTAGQARENLRINKKRYEQGMGTATEVLDAVALMTLSETNYIRSVYDYRRAEAALHYATGKNLADVYH
jgi:outer membrane protein